MRLETLVKATLIATKKQGYTLEYDWSEPSSKIKRCRGQYSARACRHSVGVSCYERIAVQRAELFEEMENKKMSVKSDVTPRNRGI